MDKKYILQYSRIEKTNWWFLVRQKIILQTIKKFVPAKKEQELQILNIGIASGHSSKWLSKLGHVVSVENDPLFLEYLEAQNFPVTNASITALPFNDNSFDLVCAFDVIEHVGDDSRAVKELWRVCKPGGNICLTVPAFQSLWGQHDIINDHVRRYKKKELHKLVREKRQGSILYSSYFNFILFVPVFIFRKMAMLFKTKGSKGRSDFSYFRSDGFYNKLPKKIFGIEPFLLKWMKFPFGVSLILLAQKKASPSK